MSLALVEFRSDPPGNTEDVWDDYAARHRKPLLVEGCIYSFAQVVIRYAFNASIDDTRKDAFRNAVTMWRVLQQHHKHLLDGAHGICSIWD